MNNHVKLTKQFPLSRTWSTFYVGLMVIFGFFYNPIIGNETVGGEDGNCLRIATYNIRRKGKEKLPAREWENRLPAVVALLEDMQPDIIGLQEAVEEQINDLANQLKSYDWFGQGRGKSWGGRGTDEYNPIFYNKKRLTLHEKGTFHINDWSWQSWLKQPHVIGLLPRICTWGLFEIKETGQTFYFYNTHLDHKFASAQFNQLKAIINRMKQNNYAANNKNNIIFLGGDFNTELDNTVQLILNEMGLRNTKYLAKNLKGPRITAPGWDNKDSRQIDHILVKDDDKNQAVTVKQHVVLQQDDQQASDHYSVYVDICFSKK